jgi:hypothetical protein
MGVNDNLFDARLPTGILHIRGECQSVDYRKLYVPVDVTNGALGMSQRTVGYE